MECQENATLICVLQGQLLKDSGAKRNNNYSREALFLSFPFVIHLEEGVLLVGYYGYYFILLPRGFNYISF